MEHFLRRGLLPGLRLVLLAGALLLAVGPYLFEPSQLAVMSEFFCLLVLALMWNLLAGYADIVSVGQQAFVGVGAYSFYGCAALWRLDPYVSVVLAGLAALVLAVPTMLVVFRLRAVYLAVGTWVVAEVLMLAAGKLPAFGGGSGTSLPIAVVKRLGASMADRYGTIYWMAFVLAVLALVATWLLLRSRIGLGLTAMRDNEEGAGAVGVNLTQTRALCFLWTAPFLGLAGALITLQKLRISPAASFSVTDWTVFVIFMVVIGGIGSLEGPLIGTAVFMLLREHLAGFGTWYLILLGSVSILVILVEPQGIWGVLRRWGLDGLIPLAHHSRLETPGSARSPLAAPAVVPQGGGHP